MSSPRILAMRFVATLLLVLACAPVRAFAQGAYEIGPADMVYVIVLDQPGLTGDFNVDPEGFINYPFLGRIKAAGLTAPGLGRKLTTLLSDGYLKRPQVSVNVKEFGSQRVFVTGEFQKPGRYSLKADRSLLTLLDSVGEATANAGHEVFVIRPPKDAPVTDGAELVAAAPTPELPKRTTPLLPSEVPGSEVFRVNLRELRSGFPDKDVRLEARDTIYLPKAAQVYIIGHVARPAGYRFEEGMSVFQALLLAGGVAERGSTRKVKIIRIVAGKSKELSAKLTDPVMPEDVIKVPERLF